MEPTKVANFSNWVSAMRIRTLFLSLACIWGGLISIQSHQELNPVITAFTLLTALFLQILSNFANDYGDTVHGADNNLRKGPLRAVQTGAIQPSSMKKAILIMSVLSFLSGCLLLYFSIPVIGWKGVALLFATGVLSIIAAITYTNGKRPYGYMGLGDLSVFLFFGIVAVAGTQYLQTGTLSLSSLLLAIAYGMLGTGVLNLNNMRDTESDKAAGKQSIPVRIGWLGSKLYHSFLILVALVCITVYFIQESLNPMASFPVAMILLTNLFLAVRVKIQSGYDPLLKILSLSTFVVSGILQTAILYL